LGSPLLAVDSAWLGGNVSSSRIISGSAPYSSMAGITGIGLLGTLIVALQVALFIALVKSSHEVHETLRPLLRGLSLSLAEFKDRFGDEDNIVTRARTRYRRALEKIEKVDTALITSSVLSYTDAVEVFGKKLRFTEYDQFYRSGPSILITLGLLGTFAGLTGNLGELSSILDSAKNSPAESLLRVSSILSPMATAFISSLVAVGLSIALWIMGTTRGTSTMIVDLGELLGAYLDQVVQANSKQYSLMRESLERMESYLTDFLSKFTDQVGRSIDKAMRDKMGEIFDSITDSADTYARYVGFIEESGAQLRDAGLCFENASRIFAESSLATEFSDASKNLTETFQAAARSSSQLIETTTGLDAILDSISDSCNQATEYFSEMNEFAKTQKELSTKILEVARTAVEELSGSTKQLREARLAVGRDARANEELVATTASRLEAVENSMNAITSTLKELIRVSKSNQSESSQALTEMKNDFIKSTAAVNESVGERIARFKESMQQMAGVLEAIARDNTEGMRAIGSVVEQASASIQQSSSAITTSMNRFQADIDRRFAMDSQTSSPSET
jgi:methyl-accepting chemotaxis protein